MLRHIYDLLDLVRRRPGMYFGYHSPTHLHSFLSGYYFADYLIEEDKNGFRKFSDFHDWVAAKLGYYESTSGWAYMIEDQREDKEEALWLFFKLLDEFRGLTPKVLASVYYKQSHTIDRIYYCRHRKVRATFEPVEKPIPYLLTIEEVLPAREWVAIYAKDESDNILDRKPCDNLNAAIKRATEIFGVNQEEWTIMP